MRKLFSLLVVGLIAAPSFVNAQAFGESDAPAYDKVLSISPFHFFDNTFYMSFEKFHVNGQSSMINLGFTLLDNRSLKKTGINLEYQHRFYLSEQTSTMGSTTYRGVYVGPYGKFRSLGGTELEFQNVPDGNGGFNFEEVEEEFSVTNYGIGAVIGTRIAKYNRFYLDFYAGGGVQYASGTNIDGIQGIFQPGYIGVTPHGGFLMGVSF